MDAVRVYLVYASVVWKLTAINSFCVLVAIPLVIVLEDFCDRSRRLLFSYQGSFFLAWRLWFFRLVFVVSGEYGWRAAGESIAKGLHGSHSELATGRSS